MKKTRSTLKDYFKKGAIPTEANFADLIDSMLTQDEDNISKLPNDPLKITATGVDEALLSFYRIEQSKEQLSWQIKQKPEGKPGLSINDTSTVASRLFIENGTGNVGIGTTSPGFNLHVKGLASAELRLDPGKWNAVGDYGQVSFGGDATHYIRGEWGNGMKFFDANRFTFEGGNVGIGTSGNPVAKLEVNGNAKISGKLEVTEDISSSGNLESKVLKLQAAGTIGILGFGSRIEFATSDTYPSTDTANAGKVNVSIEENFGLNLYGTDTKPVKIRNANLIVDKNIQLTGSQKILFTDTDTSNNLKLQLYAGYGLGINGGTLFYAANGQHSWRDNNGTNERMLLTTGADGGLTVKGTGSSSFAGNLGVGVAPNAKAKLEVQGAVTFNDGNGYALKNGYMDVGSLTIGSINKDYGGGGSGWNTNTAGLMLETKTNTEIAVHDAGTRVTSLMYFEGDTNNRITIGRDMGWGAISNVVVNGNVGLGSTAPRSRLDTGAGVMTGAANDYVKAQFNMSGGGTVSWGGPGGRLKWTNRFIAISMERSVSFASGHINISQPTTDIPAAQVYDGAARSATAAGVVLNGWEALYAVHTVGGNEVAVTYRIVNYTQTINAPSNWLLVAVVNDDDKTVKLGTGMILSQNSSSSHSSSIPRGVITMWSGAADNFPYGWVLCDGNNGAPDLRDRFVVGAGSSYRVGNVGGANSVAITIDQMPSHNHNNGEYGVLLHRDGSGRWTSKDTDTTVGEPDLIHNADIVSAGGNQAHENRPPYYALAYIMKL